jgi:hypothetical protein
MKKLTPPSTSETADLPNAAEPAPTDGVANAVAVLVRTSNNAVHQVQLNVLEHSAVRAVIRAMFRDRVPVFADPLPGVSLGNPAPLLESELLVEINKPARKRAAKKAAARQTRKATKE